MSGFIADSSYILSIGNFIMYAQKSYFFFIDLEILFLRWSFDVLVLSWCSLCLYRTCVSSITPMIYATTENSITELSLQTQ